MGKDSKRQVDKIVQLIWENNLSKLKSYRRKHHIDLADILIGGRNTLLHLACKLGHDDCMRFLIKKGVDCTLCNKDGDLPLHLAAKCVLSGNSHAYTDLVEPLVKIFPEGLDVQNNSHTTPRAMLERFMEYRRSQEESFVHDTAEDDFNARLANEMQDEYSEHWGKYEQDYDYRDGFAQESFHWTERIRREKHNKEHKNDHRKHKSRTKQRKAEEKEKKDFQRKLEEEHAEYLRKNKRKDSQRALLIQKKKNYEQKWNTIIDKCSSSDMLTYTDIPWPAKGTVDSVVKVLVSDLSQDEDSEKYKKQLRKQQIRWHPDKFLQKCGTRLEERDKDKIMNRVKKISQALNQLIEEHRAQ